MPNTETVWICEWTSATAKDRFCSFDFCYRTFDDLVLDMCEGMWAREDGWPEVQVRLEWDDWIHEGSRKGRQLNEDGSVRWYLWANRLTIQDDPGERKQDALDAEG